MRNNGMKCQDMGDAMAGVKECLLVLGKLRESTSGVADSSTASILFGHPGDYASCEAFREQVVANGTPVVKRRR